MFNFGVEYGQRFSELSFRGVAQNFLAGIALAGIFAVPKKAAFV